MVAATSVGEAEGSAWRTAPGGGLAGVLDRFESGNVQTIRDKCSGHGGAQSIRADVRQRLRLVALADLSGDQPVFRQPEILAG